jgi:type I restriction enzyme, S subunit
VKDLPPGWVSRKLGEIAETRLGRMLSAGRETGEHAKPYLRNRDVQWGHINVNQLPVMDFGPREAARFLLQPGDVLVCEGGEVGRAAIWTGQLRECYYQKALHRIRVSQVLMPEFLRYLLEYYAGTRAFERFTSGSTIAHLPQEDLRRLPIPVPSIEEQKRIVAAVDEQLSRLDVGTVSLNRVRRNLARMSAAILERAVEFHPELTSRARDQEYDYGGQQSPASWPIVRVSEVAQVSGGITKNPKRRPSNNMVPFLRVANVMRSQLDLREVHNIEIFGDELQRFRLRRGDLLVVEGNGSPDQIGRSALWDGSIDPCVHQNHLIRVRPGESILPEYLNIFWNAPSGRAMMQSAASSTSGLHTLSTGKVKAIRLPLPPLELQRLIVTDVDMRLSAVAELTNRIAIAEARTKRLRRAILATAFSGSLVDQDASYDPASSMVRQVAVDDDRFSESNKGIATARLRAQVAS